MTKSTTEKNDGARERTVPTEGEICRAYKKWRETAPKNSVIEAFRGPASIEHIIKPPEARMSRPARTLHNEAIRHARAKAKRSGTKYKVPPIPDEFKLIRADIMALELLLDSDELRGLIEIKKIVLGKIYVYEVKMLVQRNGLSAVRSRI